MMAGDKPNGLGELEGLLGDGVSTGELFEMLKAASEQKKRDAEWQATIEDAIGDAVAAGRFVIMVASVAPDDADSAKEALRVFQTSRAFPYSQFGPMIRDLLNGLTKL